MACIRLLELENFRTIRKLAWRPASGINCLIGPGDSGKSSVLDAIDLCLSARRTLSFTDADFHALNVGEPIRISVTLGALAPELKSLDAYGLYLRGFDATTGTIEDEPAVGLEPVLTVQLTVGSDLEPSWTLVSERAPERATNLRWADRLLVSPARIGASPGYHLAWGRGSVLNRVSKERADASANLAKAAREARTAFGDHAEDRLKETLRLVGETAKELGVDTGERVRALLDPHSVSFGDGTISLHDEDGVPLRGLGTGSMRLLIAGLQRKAVSESGIVLVDEVEHGLEPHRIIRFLGSLGAKEKPAPLQAFVTTHSPVVLQELAGEQLFVIRSGNVTHNILNVGGDDPVQGTIRRCPDAFLARMVIACEGASEVGLLRGLDLFRVNSGEQGLGASGCVLLDGGGIGQVFKRALALLRLGYPTAVVHDSDQPPPSEHASPFSAEGGFVVKWRPDRALEDELFLSLGDSAVRNAIEMATRLHGVDLVDDQIKSASDGSVDLDTIDATNPGPVSKTHRTLLGRAARSKQNGWFKRVGWMEELARTTVGPDLTQLEDPVFGELVERIFGWVDGGGKRD